MLQSYKEMGARMSSKMHFLHSRSEFFPKYKVDVSDEHGERFHLEIKLFEESYQGNVSPAMVADVWWSLQRDTDKDFWWKRRCLLQF